MGDQASERGLGGFARLSSSWAPLRGPLLSLCRPLLATLAYSGLAWKRPERVSPAPGQARFAKALPPGLTPCSPCPRKGGEKGQTDVHYSNALRGWTCWSLVLFCFLNDLGVAGKLTLLRTHGAFVLEDDMLKAKAPSFKAILSHQGYLLASLWVRHGNAAGTYNGDSGRHHLCQDKAKRLVRKVLIA